MKKHLSEPKGVEAQKAPGLPARVFSRSRVQLEQKIVANLRISFGEDALVEAPSRYAERLNSLPLFGMRESAAEPIWHSVCCSRNRGSSPATPIICERAEGDEGRCCTQTVWGCELRKMLLGWSRNKDIKAPESDFGHEVKKKKSSGSKNEDKEFEEESYFQGDSQTG